MQLPADFLRETRKLMGETRFQRYMEAFEEEPPVSLRLNPLKAAHATVGGATPVPWCHDGYYLNGRPNFTFDPLLHAGCYYVQEAASMFIDHVLRQYVHQPVLMLDLCAAPGGKSTATRSALPPGSMLVSNEPIRQRAQILVENLQKWGHDGCIVTNAYPEAFAKSRALFDVVLCDVPCSGEGMFRKDEATVGEWSLQHVEHCWQLQRDIVTQAWKCLADGGLMVYSTCTFNTRENEENVQWMEQTLGAELLPVDTDDAWGITGSLLSGFEGSVYRFIPGITRGEGLFVAVMRKPGNSESQGSCLQSAANVLRRLPGVLNDGKPTPTQKGKDLVPPHAEALSTGFDRSKYAMAPLSYEQALAYLRREAIVLPPDVPRGYVAVSFLDMPLGFVKNIGNRANNLYPQEWRIRSTHLPQAYQPIITLSQKNP